ncbi:hypothetical protein ACN0O4_003003, partial [Escherichia albertii]
LAHLIRPTIGAGSVGRIRRLRRIRQAQGSFYQQTRILLKVHSFYHHCHHSVIFPVEANAI